MHRLVFVLGSFVLWLCVGCVDFDGLPPEDRYLGLVSDPRCEGKPNGTGCSIPGDLAKRGACTSGVCAERFIVKDQLVYDSRLDVTWWRGPISSKKSVNQIDVDICGSIAPSRQWRLPTVEQLESLVVQGEGIDRAVFNQMPRTSAISWTRSTTRATSACAYPGEYYAVTFDDLTGTEEKIRVNCYMGNVDQSTNAGFFPSPILCVSMGKRF